MTMPRTNRLPRKALLRKWKNGYRLQQLALEHGLSQHEVARVLSEAGVAWLTIENRDRRGKPGY